MAKLRSEDVASLDVKELESAEYSTEEFDRYYGEVPPVGTELTAYVKRMWWTRSATKANGSGNDPMLKILTVAADNEGDLEQYNDCPFWLNAALNAGSKFRWGPFLDNFQISIRAIKARKVDVEDKTDQNGAPIISIDGFRPGEDSDEAWCRIITEQEPYNGVMSPRVKEWLPYDDEDDEEGEDAEEAADDEADDEYEEEDGEEDGEEAEAEPEPAPARGRRGAARSATTAAAPARGRRPAASAPARPAASGSAPRGGRSSGRAPAPAAAPARRGRGRAAKDDIPF
jgi:hypothetical protein